MKQRKYIWLLMTVLMSCLALASCSKSEHSDDDNQMHVGELRAWTSSILN